MAASVVMLFSVISAFESKCYISISKLLVTKEVKSKAKRKKVK